jgi:signal transduction histidine kinase
MKNLQSAQAVGSSARVSWSWEGLDLPKKATLIRVRWPFTIVCSYLLLYSQNVSIDPAALQGFVLIYLFSNLALYFVEERFFESLYFFAPLIAFDTLFLTATLAVNGKAGSEFYVVCFATIFLCCICRDLRGLMGVAVLSPLLYGYFLLRSTEAYDPTIYLRIIFPFVIALFYGYFAQVELLQTKLKKQTELADRAARFSSAANALAAEKDRLGEELERTRQLLETASRAKKEFLGVMSHELRTPLNVVMGYARLLKEQVLGNMNPMQSEAAAKIMSRARDQLTMITDILQVASIESGESLSSGQEVGLPGLLDELKSHYEAPEGKEVALEWDYPADLPAVKTDAEKLKHALQNLINNALKFTHRGAVRISVRAAIGDQELGIEDQGLGVGPDSPSLTPNSQIPNPNSGFVGFTVSDTGIGISEEHLPSIFDSFHQIDSSDTRRYDGVGMGLYVVKKLAAILGARIHVTSAPGQGSTFTLSLPYEKPERSRTKMPIGR